MLTEPETIDDVSQAHLDRASIDAAWHVKIAELAFEDVMTTWNKSCAELIAEGEVYTVEFKQTARWNVREHKKDKLIEQIVQKTVAGFGNASGGTLLLGVHDELYPVGLEADLALVKPPDVDGYVNWLDTMLENAFGFAFASNIKVSVEDVDGKDVCRVNVPRSPDPLWVMFKGEERFFVRRNNSTREVPSNGVENFIATRFG